MHLLGLQVAIRVATGTTASTDAAHIVVLLVQHAPVVLMHHLLVLGGGLLLRATGDVVVAAGPVGRGPAALARDGATTALPPILIWLQLLAMALSKRLLLHCDRAGRHLLLDLLLEVRQLAHGLPWWLVLRL